MNGADHTADAVGDDLAQHLVDLPLKRLGEKAVPGTSRLTSLKVVSTFGPLVQVSGFLLRAPSFTFESTGPRSLRLSLAADTQRIGNGAPLAGCGRKHEPATKR